VSSLPIQYDIPTSADPTLYANTPGPGEVARNGKYKENRVGMIQISKVTIILEDFKPPKAKIFRP
jgi:hypothetical protein